MNDGGSIGSKEIAGRNTKRISPAIHWGFTFNNYDLEYVNGSMVPKLKGVCSKYIFQEEIGEKTGTPHLQGYCHFNTKIRPFSLGLSDKISWYQARKKYALQTYCTKSKTKKEGGLRWTFNITLPQELKLLEYDNLYKWQKQLIEILNKEPDDRSIIWIYELKGKTGKTQFCKFLLKKYEKEVFIVGGKSNDMKYHIMSKVNKKIYPHAIIIDLVRSTENYLSYEGIEAIKNGIFFSGKYECEECIYNSPHVVIFSNYLPEYHRLSLDRWTVFKIEEMELVQKDIDKYCFDDI